MQLHLQTTTNTPFLLLLTLLALSLFIPFPISISSFFNITNNPHSLSLPTLTTPLIHLQTLSHCDASLYHHLCLTTLTPLQSKSLPHIITATINQTLKDVQSTDFNVTAIRRKLRNLTTLEIRALDDCHSLLLQTLDDLNSAISNLKRRNPPKHHDLQTLLSAAMTNQATCLDGFAFTKSRNKIPRYLHKSLRHISRQVSNSLALLKKMKGTSKGKAEAFPEYGETSGGYPRWLRKKDWALLQSGVNEMGYDLVVAKDGSGNFTTIGDALNAAPNGSTTRFVIYIKAGAYYEYLEIDSRKTMVMLVGDGIGKTLIKGNRSVVDGWTTFRSATVGKQNTKW